MCVYVVIFRALSSKVVLPKQRAAHGTIFVVKCGTKWTVELVNLIYIHSKSRIYLILTENLFYDFYHK
jgi:hypothetical protein